MVSMEIGLKRSTNVKVTDKMIRQFAEMSGDFNPIHLDDEYASKTIFKKRIAHGMILGALVSRILTEEIGTGGVYLAQTLKFSKPVFIDDEITFELEVIKFHKGRGFGVVATNAKNQSGEYVMKGEATIMMAYGVKE